jgi:hypothetical protein
LVLHVAQEIPRHFWTERNFYSKCSNIGVILFNFHILIAEELSTIREPLYVYVETLSRRDGDIRSLFSELNEQACCGTRLIIGLPRDQRFLYYQLLSLAEDQQPPAQEVTSPPSIDPTCAVCWDRVAVDEFIHSKLVNECEHEANVCRSCLAQSITAQLDVRRWNQLTCPLCPAKLDSNMVEKYAPTVTIQR